MARSGSVSQLPQGSARRHGVLGDARGKNGASGSASPPIDDRPRLRLVVTRGRLGVELEAPFALGPLVVGELGVGLPEVRFPVDLTGGVTAFRNRRGELERLTVEVRPAVSRWARAALAGLLDPGTPELLLAPTEDGFLVGVRGESSALAFEVLVGCAEDVVQLVPVQARGLGLGATPAQLALQALSVLTRPYGAQQGGAVVVRGVAKAISRALLPLAGMRAPSTAGLAWSRPSISSEGLRLSASTEGAKAPPSARVVSAVELARLVAAAEEALIRGRLEDARREYLAALERAPRHPEIVRRICELDRVAGGRAATALDLLSELGPAVDEGALGAELLSGSGARDAARVAFERAGEAEVFGPLAALAHARAAELCGDDDAGLRAIDEAIARAPGWDALRWRRFMLRIARGDEKGAKADVEHLEAAAHGAENRHLVLRRAGDTLLRARFLPLAAEIFERALRYLPESLDAVAGLGRTLFDMAQGRRALELFSRAVAIAERRGIVAHSLTIELGKALAAVADDRPAAISHVRSVPALVAQAVEARACEGRWRAELGDHVGASEAYARMADEIDRVLPALVEAALPGEGRALEERDAAGTYGTRRDAASATATWLEEAARFEATERRDLHAAKRLLGVALRLVPTRRSLGSRFREVSEALERLAAAPGTPSRGVPRGAPAHAVSQVAPFHAVSQVAPSHADDAMSSSPPASSPPAASPAPDSELSASSPPSESSLPESDSRESDSPESSPPAPSSPGRMLPVIELPSLAPSGDEDDERLVEELSERLRGDPNNADVVRRLAAALERLGRDHELLALLAARIEEGGEPPARELIPLRGAVLARLRDQALAEGRGGEAELYALMLARD